MNERDRRLMVSAIVVRCLLASVCAAACLLAMGAEVAAQQTEPRIVRPNDPLPSKATVANPEVLERTPVDAIGGPENMEEPEPTDRAPLDFIAGGPDEWTSPEGLAGSLQVMLLLTVLSLAPAILLMTTCYVRIIIVLGLLRQAIGLQSLPPSQVMTSVALFMTLFVMTPVWTRVYDDAIKPYTDPDVEMSLEEA
ncbi:MAG: flagellar biosynthetic protein FliP, partial [Rhodopirellula sp. JB055]